MADPVKVLVTGASGPIAYSLLPRIASGEVFGRQQPVFLVLMDLPTMWGVLSGVAMELQDCAFELLQGVTVTDRDDVAFRDVDVAVLLGAMPKAQSVENNDQFKCSVQILRSQGKALDTYAKKTVKVLAVGSPANTNCLVAMMSAPSIPPANFSCLTRLDQNRAQARLALALGTGARAVRNVIVWGNSSGMLHPDFEHAMVTCDSRPFRLPGGSVTVRHFLVGQAARQRGETMMGCAMSVVSAICDHLRALWSGTQEGELLSMGVLSNGNSYGVPEQLIYSFPVSVKDGNWQIVPGLRVSDDSRLRMAQSARELVKERERALRALVRSNL
ncbi:malate dehydrogenase, cytoplasmic-like isoform X2 [Stegostoma tigrinum]|uniref:malate dehydrogenase, cytoplasmic-like isoform X2 n=1 Tax=Stegostoma tigrinum TaxID=3053191 RepID=UPI0028708DD3|nr:malate dehydrogenase, cytoplasmic-like isoform X2 [Stegostoma tigrinum]